MKIILFLLFSLLTIGGKAQTKIKMDKDGNYIAFKPSGKATGKTYTDLKGNVYPILITDKGKLYIEAISSKTGKTYRKYLKIEE